MRERLVSDKVGADCKKQLQSFGVLVGYKDVRASKANFAEFAYGILDFGNSVGVIQNVSLSFLQMQQTGQLFISTFAAEFNQCILQRCKTMGAQSG